MSPAISPFARWLLCYQPLALVFCYRRGFIGKLKKRQIGQQVRDDGPKSHFSKAGTPTMGGGLIIFACILPALLWMDWLNPLLWCVVVITIGYGIIGFLDDYMKVSKKNTKGLSGRKKLIGQFGLALLTCSFYYYYSGNGELRFPFFKDAMIDLGWAYIPFGMLVIVGASNAVNLTDGLDGLAIGPVMTTAGTFTILSYVAGHFQIAEYLQIPFLPGAGELAIFCCCPDRCRYGLSLV